MFVGRLTPQKKLSVLFELVAVLAGRGTDVNLLFIGDGESRKELTGKAEALGVSERVVFYGACHDEDELAPLIGMADICVSPGEVGMTAIHSMSFGTPVITHDDPLHQMPEFESIVEGETGALFERDSLSSLVQCVTEWLKSNPDREQVRRRCFSMVDSRYNPEYQVQEIVKAL